MFGMRSGSSFPNFSRDSREISRAIAILIAGAGAVALSLSLYLAWASQELNAKADANDALRAKMIARVLELRAETQAAPKPEDIASLRHQLLRLDAADDARGLDIEELLDAIEQRLPDTVRISNLDYDRSKGVADVVATSASSQDLTDFFGSLDREAKFVGVRLVDKMQVRSSASGEIQAHLIFELPKASSVRKGGLS